MTDYSKGSEWRKWDLHVHTPGTAKNDLYNGQDAWNKYVDKLEELKDIAVLGVTDYFSIDNYLKLKRYQAEGRLPNVLLIPNIELRILPVTKTDTPINIHVLFDPELDTSVIEREFFRELKFRYSSSQYSCIKQDLIALGKKYDSKIIDDTKAWKVGIEQFNVPLKDLQEVLSRESLVGYYFVGVSNSSKDGNSGIQHSCLAATREEIYRLSDFIFSGNKKDQVFFLGNSQFSKKQIKDKYRSLKPCIVGSDAHSFDSMGIFPHENITWIKADPTFNGLRQAIIEPEERVYIGEEPPLFKSINDNGTKFIKSITVKPISSYSDEHGIWFNNIVIPLNKELIAIIGNKGNGKSAIADIIALCCDYQEQHYFSFLKKGKFRDGKLAQNFEGTVTFESGVSKKRKLDSIDSSNNQALIKYLPQGYFEGICNDLEKIDLFRKEIESIVFQYIDEPQRLGKSSFKELIDARTNTVREAIVELKGQIELVNKEIIELEKKENKNYRENLDSRIRQKKAELTSLEKPAIVENPNENGVVSNQESLALIEKHKIEIETIEKAIDENKSVQNSLFIEIEELNNILKAIENQEVVFNSFKEKYRSELGKYEINVDNVIDFSTNVTEIISLKGAKDKVLSEIKERLDANSDSEGSLISQLRRSREKLKVEQDKLDVPQKLYHKYILDIEEWEKKRKQIEGSESTPNTLSWLNKEKEYLLNGSLQHDIQLKSNERLEIVKQIYEKKKQIVAIYENVKVQIDSIISQNKNLLEDYEIVVEASLLLTNNFKNNFFNFISQNVLGSFKGKIDGSIELNRIIEAYDIQTSEGLVGMLNDIVSHLKKDSSKNNEERYVDEQVQDMQAFYNYLYSLDYIDYNYQLKQGDKNLETLSPGEKGALLLVFYLLLDMDNRPLILDQPEDNLDNDSVANILVNFIKQAKKKRQIIIVTHNPNLAVVSDAEQVIYVNIEKKNKNKFSFESGSIENPQINKHIVDVLEGAMPAFRKRDNKYIGE